MAYVIRTKDEPGEVGRAADQQESVENDVFFKDIVEGAYVIRRIVSKTGLVDNVATEVFTITTTDEAGNTDAGVYEVKLHGVVVHGELTPTLGATACAGFGAQFCRAMRNAGVGINSPVIENLETAVAATVAGTKSISAITMTATETSEYEVAVKFTVNLTGTSIGTAEVYLMVELVWAGFTTAPEIA